MRPRQPSCFLRLKRHTYRLELVLDFGSAISGNEAREVTRRILDALQVSVLQPQNVRDPESVRLTCHELRRSLQLNLSLTEATTGT